MSGSSSFFTSSLGRKYVMGITGIFLITFLIVHAGINALIFIDNTGALFNSAAHFMATNWVIRSMELVLFLGIILHIVQAVILTRQNKQARPQEYAYANANANSLWYSRSMGLLGTLILIFLIIHLGHFWVKARFGIPEGIPEGMNGEHDMFFEMKEVFSNLWVVVVYVLAMVSLAYHLLHGFQSSFQSLGLNHHKYTPAIKKIGIWYSIVISVVFALMPLYVYFFLKN
ncbi:succinate dehydrogenase cytochrome b subunit [Solitalea koreensis]|uniref:Succinate dehydrogenase / fumarate reductase cytochrome b subunit n=1 Tax=Solitalea koreensis TaxID=543615 RepID=A0A521C5H4_9SPHI|nr:succinate dehydrogenase cytochrome b subunit [Solitalea koreensis]SMO54669.1 succinate dehydrogenase / fumarate reductase cytochrome b subunit [Solitalea koreensis]